MPRPMVVATAAPVTPSSRERPDAEDEHGPSTMLMALASQSTRIAIAGVAGAAEDGVDQEQQHRP